MLQIRLFGKPQVICDGTDITPELGNKGCALLCILFLRGGDYYAREKLAAYLWPDSAASAAKYNLRYTLWKIKKSTDIGEGGRSLIKLDREYCCIDRAYDYICDLQTIDEIDPETRSADELKRACDAFGGELLEGYYFNHCEDLNELILSQRIYYEKRKNRLLMKAAEHGNCSAAFTLGQLYLSGTTMLRDPAAAVRWLERAAEGGNQHAQYRLGKLLLQGEDVPKDADGAVHWLTASAEQGNQYAQYALGKLDLLGEEVPEDREAARQWLQRAAEQGNQYAQYFVEHMDRRDLFPVAQSVAQLIHHLAGIFREQSQPPRPRGLRLTVDKKLWRKIREKKIAMGHKPDDHEEPTITM